MDPNIPKSFNLKNYYEDLTSTYVGRIKFFFNIINPLRALVTDKQVKDSQLIINNYNQKNPSGKEKIPMNENEITNLIEADSIVKSVIHPDTGKPIPCIFRMSWFVPSNLPIILGMLTSRPTPFNIAFWQWINQTYNAGWNYSNRNATSPFTNKELAMSYIGAVGASVGVALLGGRLTRRFQTTTGSRAKQVFLNGALAVSAMCIAGFLNLYLIRSAEMKKGIHVFHNGVDHGISRKAAEIAVFNSALTRCVLPLPIVIVPPALWWLVERVKQPKNKLSIMLIDIIICTIQLTISLPPALALFKQEMEVDASKLEKEFQCKIEPNTNKPITRFMINKGL